MSDPTGQPVPQPGAPEPPAPTDPAPAGGDPPQDEPLGEGGKKALAAEREARKAAEKAAAEAAAKVKEFEDRDKSELQKLAEARATAEEAAAKATREALRWRIAAKHRIADDDAETFLTGADGEALTRQAERLAELHAAGQQSAPPPTTTHRPTERLKAGTDPTRGDAPSLAEQIAAAERAGEWAKARALKSQQVMELAKQQH